MSFKSDLCEFDTPIESRYWGLDEPYAQDILAMILKGEEAKGL